MKKILHLSTGGTITGCAPEYPEIEELAKSFSDSTDIKKYLTLSFKIHADYSMKAICNKDSREITTNDRDVLREEILQAHQAGVRHILITHGTYTMPDTGLYLINHLPEDVLHAMCIVITGAMYPMNLEGGDGLLNLGAAVSSLINADHALGVIICMHGKNWHPGAIQKDAKNLIFREIV